MDEQQEQQLRAAAQHVLARLGPLEVWQLADELSNSDLVDTEVVPDPEGLWHLLLEELEEGFAAFPLADGRLCDLDAVIDGLTLTRVLTASERGADRVAMEEDLLPLVIAEDHTRDLTLAGGGVLRNEGRALAGPAGWVPDAPVIALTWSHGACVVTGLEAAPEVDQNTAERLAEVYELLRQRDQVTDVVELVFEARARFPRLLSAPAAPLSDLLAAGGLRVVDDQVLAEDEPDPDSHDPLEELEAHLRVDHDLSEEEVVDVLLVHAAIENLRLRVENVVLRRLDEDASPPRPEQVLEDTFAELLGTDPDDGDPGSGGAFTGVPGAVARLLADEELAAVLLEDVVAGERLRAVILAEVLETLERHLPHRRARANAVWVRAVLLELTGDDHSATEPLLRRALELDADHIRAAIMLSRCLEDRGRAGPARAYLQRFEGRFFEEDIAFLSRYAAPGPVAAERNSPCPCGSGRKYKVCCQRSNGWPLGERIEWVWRKVSRLVASPAGQDTVVEVAIDAGVTHHLDEAMEDPFVVNLALYEAELLADLCDLRGALLPADELELLRSWSQVRASAQEVVEVTPGTGLTVLDLTSGERTEVVDRSLSRELEVGDAVLAWLVPTPKGVEPSVGICHIPDHQRERVLALLDEGGGAEPLARWYASLSAPPSLVTMDGEPTELIRRVYRVDDPDAVWAGLAAQLEEDGDSLVAFTERDGTRWLKGSITRDGDLLVVQVNSAARAVWFDEVVRDVAPAAEVVDEERRSVGDFGWGGDGAEEGPHGAGFDLDALEPEERRELEEQLDAMMAAHEDAWVDTPLQALSGASPREASDDPTRRDRVLRLLEEIATHSRSWNSPGRPMDADRLRALLGL